MRRRRTAILLIGLAATAVAASAQSVSPPAVTPAPNPADPFAAIKAGRQTPAQYQAQYRYMAAVDPRDPFHNWGGNLWNQTWEGQWLAAHARGQTFEQFWNSLPSAEVVPMRPADG